MIPRLAILPWITALHRAEDGPCGYRSIRYTNNIKNPRLVGFLEYDVLHVLHIWFVPKTGTKNSSEVSLCWLSAQWQNEYATGITVLGTFSRRTWDTFNITGKPSWAANLTKCSNHLFSAKTRTTCYFHVVWKRLKCKVSHGCVILHCFTSVYNFQL